MSKASILKGLSTVCNVLGAASGLSTVAGFLPPKYAGIAVVVLVAAQELHKAALAIGDQIDDGQANGSFKA